MRRMILLLVLLALAPALTAQAVPMQEALTLAEKAISPTSHHAVLAELRTIQNQPVWALLFQPNVPVDDGHIWVTVDMQRHVVTHGIAITQPFAPDPAQVPLTRPKTSTETIETLSALPIDMEALNRLKGPQVFQHEGRTLALDLTAWEWTMVADGPHMGPDGVHVLGTFAKTLPGLEGQANLTIWLLPFPHRDGEPLDPLPPASRTPAVKRLLALGGQPGTLLVTSPLPRVWQATTEQTGPGWRLRLEMYGSGASSAPLEKEMARLGASLRRISGMSTAQ